MGIQGSIPSIEELIMRNTMLNGEFWTTIPSGSVPMSTGALADGFGIWNVIVAANTFPTQFITPTLFFPVTTPTDAVYEVMYGYGIAGGPVQCALVRYQRQTSTLVSMKPFTPVPVKSVRFLNNGLGELAACVRCSIAGPQALDTQHAVLVYPVGV